MRAAELEEHLSEIRAKYPINTTQLKIKLKTMTKQPTTISREEVCPECSGELVPQSGCVICMQCGWSLCSN